MKMTLLWLALASSSLSASGAPPRSPQEMGVEESMQLQMMRIAEDAGDAVMQRALGEKGVLTLEQNLERAGLLIEEGHWLTGLRFLVEAQFALGMQQSLRSTAGIQRLPELLQAADELLSKLQSMPAPLAEKRGRPAELQALLEEHFARATSFAKAAPDYGRETNLAAGKFYLSEGRAHAMLASWLGGLQPPRALEPQAQLAALEGYLERLEAELLQIHASPLSSKKQQSLIQISGGLKFSRELLDQKYEAAALREALQVARGLALIAPASEGRPRPKLDQLEAKLAERQRQLSGLSGDSSIAKSYVNEARRSMEVEGQDWELAEVLIDRVLGDYLACRGASAEVVGGDRESEVRITLVRWPFT